jgi:hypothetical protein
MNLRTGQPTVVVEERDQQPIMRVAASGSVFLTCCLCSPSIAVVAALLTARRGHLSLVSGDTTLSRGLRPWEPFDGSPAATDGSSSLLLGGCLLVGTDFEHPGLSVSAANTKMVQVFVKSVRGPTLTLDMAPNATVRRLTYF